MNGTHYLKNLIPALIALKHGQLGLNVVDKILQIWQQHPEQDTFRLMVTRGILQESDSSWVYPLANHLSRDPNFDIESEFESFSVNLSSTLRKAESRFQDRDSPNPVAPTEAIDVRADISACNEEDTEKTAFHPRNAVRYSNPQLSASNTYRILQQHARGGLGLVSIAEDQRLQRRIAIKEIQDRFADDPGTQARFTREAQLTGRLEHPGIVPIYSVGSFDNGRPYYAMRFINGTSLKQAIEELHTKANSTSDSRRIDFSGIAFRHLLGRFVDVCNAIAYAHSQGVLHRDLKPSNIMLGEYGETLVVDWGLAKEIISPGYAEIRDPNEDTLVHHSAHAKQNSPALTGFGVAIGTPAYMSPEQAAGNTEDLTVATDIYALGATLYTLLTNRAPFSGKQGQDIIHQVLSEQPPAPREIISHIPEALEAVCLNAMRQDPQDRYSSATQLAQDIEQFLADQPVTVFQESLSARTRRWLRHHPKVLAGISASLIIGLGSSLIGASIVAGKNDELVSINSDLSESNQRTLAAKELSQKNAIAAREVVNDFLVEVTDAQFLKSGTTVEQAFRIELLEKAKNYYESLINDNKDIGNAESRWSLADSYFRLASIERDLGNFASGLENIELALNVLTPERGSPKESPDVYDRLAELNAIKSYIESDMGHNMEAVESLKEAVRLRQELYDSDPSDLLVYRNLGRLKSSLSLILIELGDVATGTELANEANKAFKQVRRTDDDYVADKYDEMLGILSLAQAKSESGELQESIALLRKGCTLSQQMSRNVGQQIESNIFEADFRQNLALDLGRTGQVDEAMKELDKAISIRERLVAADHGEFKNKLYLANAYKLKSEYHSDSNDVVAAMQACNTAVEMLKKLQAEHPTVKEVRNYYSNAIRQRGEILFQLGNQSSGMQDYVEALAHLKESVSGPHATQEDKHALALMLNNYANAISGPGAVKLQLDYYRQAAELIDEVVSTSPEMIFAQVNRGKIYGNLGQVLSEDGQTTAAVEMLEKSIEAHQFVYDHSDITEAAASLAWAYNRLASRLTNNDDSKAVEWFEKAIEFWDQSCDREALGPIEYTKGLGGILVNAADSYQHFQLFYKAHKSLDRADALMAPFATGPNAHPVITRYQKNGVYVRRRTYRHELSQELEADRPDSDLNKLRQMAMDNLQLDEPPSVEDYRVAAEFAFLCDETEKAKELLISGIEIADGVTKEKLQKRVEELEN